MSNYQEKERTSQELTPELVNSLLSQYNELQARAWHERGVLTHHLVEIGKPELAEPDVIRPYIHAMLEAQVKRENPRVLPFVDLFDGFVSPDVLEAGFERLFLGEQIRGNNLEIEGTAGDRGFDVLHQPYKQPPSADAIILDRTVDQIQSVHRFAAVVDGKVALIDAYSDPRSPAIVPFNRFPDVIGDAGRGLVFNLQHPQQQDMHRDLSVDEKLELAPTDWYDPSDCDEINRLRRILVFAESQPRIKILGEVSLPELGIEGMRGFQPRVPVYGRMTTEFPLFMDWAAVFNSLG